MKAIQFAAMPDSALVTDAAELVRGICNDKIFNHSLRTHYLAVQYAARYKKSFDPEQLALACLFHDTGLMPDCYSPDRSFIFNSSQALKDYAIGRSVDPQKIDAAMQAIDWHFHVLPRWDLGEVAGLLQVGAWMDVTGLRCWRVFDAYRRSKKLFDKRGFFLYFNACLARQLIAPKRALGLLAPGRNLPAQHYCCDSHAP